MASRAGKDSAAVRAFGFGCVSFRRRSENEGVGCLVLSFPRLDLDG
jgi:hypothetical protein